MQIAADVANAPSSIGASLPEVSSSFAAYSPFADCKVIRRNGAVVSFGPSKISVAVTKTFLAVEGEQGAASARIHELVAALTGNTSANGFASRLEWISCMPAPQTLFPG